MSMSRREVKRNNEKFLYQQNEETKKKMHRFIRTCFYANSLDESQLAECVKTGLMPGYPKYIEQILLEQHYTTENKVETKLVISEVSQTDIMALENIFRKRFGK
jgi:hypothetical protein